VERAVTAPVEAAARPLRRLHDWFFAPVPLARIALLRLAVFAFVVVDVLKLHTSGYYHGWADQVWYEPLDGGKLLHLPAATVALVLLLKWGSVVFALAAMTGRAPKLLGWATAVCWIWYQYVAFSYGKVDHDRTDFVLALVLLPTVGIAHLSDERKSEAAGWAIRCVQLITIATYFFSAWAKLRFGGIGWVNSATLTRAVVRRGTDLGDALLHVPHLMHVSQYLIISAELLSPLIFFVPERLRRLMVAGWYAFHVMVYATITIAFWPHLVVLLSFLPLEEYRDSAARRWRQLRSGPSESVPEPRPGDAAVDGSAQAGVPPGSDERLRATQR
jgi:hypothetical protein